MIKKSQNYHSPSHKGLAGVPPAAAMVWLLPLIVIAGLFFPLLGYLVILMMAFLLVLSFSSGRLWCRQFCPRGAFLDIILSRFSLNRPIPTLFTRQWFRWTVLMMMFIFLSYRLVCCARSPLAIGAIFVMMCLVTTLIAIVLGIFTKHRCWCSICPMGTLQEKINKLNKNKNIDK